MDKHYSESFIGLCPKSNKYEQILINFIEFPNTNIVGRKASGFKCPVNPKCANPNECPIYLKHK